MAKITFKSKVYNVYNMDDTLDYSFVVMPKKITSSHYSRSDFHSHPKYGPYSNSSLLPAVIMRALRDNNIKEHIRLDSIPECVKIDTSKFLAEVTVEI